MECFRWSLSDWSACRLDVSQPFKCYIIIMIKTFLVVYSVTSHNCCAQTIIYLNNIRYGGDLSSRVRASDYIVSVYNVACNLQVCVQTPGVVVYNLLLTVRCQNALSVVCLRIIFNLVVRPSRTLTIYCILLAGCN